MPDLIPPIACPTLLQEVLTEPKGGADLLEKNLKKFYAAIHSKRGAVLIAVFRGKVNKYNGMVVG